MQKDTGNGKHTPSAAVKPIRPTVLVFETEDEMKNFIEYATSSKKILDDPALNRMRELLKSHKRSPRKE